MRFERRLKPRVNIDLTPMIDVVFQLVIFFMITSVFKTAPGIALNLPASSTAVTVSLTELRIALVSDTEIYVNRQRTDLVSLEGVVRKLLEGKDLASVRASVEGDKAASYQLIVGALDAIRKSGLEGVSLVTRPLKALP